MFVQHDRRAALTAHKLERPATPTLTASGLDREHLCSEARPSRARILLDRIADQQCPGPAPPPNLLQPSSKQMQIMRAYVRHGHEHS